LIIEDEQRVRRVTRLALQAARYEVGVAKDGEAELELFGNGAERDAVLLDQRLPGIDGLETLRRIKQSQASARLIIFTADGSIELTVRAMKLGATDFVRKPMTPEILRNAVTAALAKPRSTSESIASPLRKTSAVPLIQIVTMNGFTILESEGGSLEPDERRSREESHGR
jgi:DNA-binding response OmpR family regulator